MNKKLIGLGVVALLAVLALGVTLPKADVSSVSQGPQGIQGERGIGIQGPQGERGPAGQSVQGLDRLLSALQGLLATLQSQPTQPKLGAFPSPDILNPYLSVNGVTTFYEKASFNTASSSLCSLLSPTATSTLNFTGQVTTGTTTALYILLQDIQASSTKRVIAFAPPLASATGTLRVLETLASNSLGSMVVRATSTNDNSGMNVFNAQGVVKPNTTLVLHARTQNGSAALSQAGTGQVLKGKCNATFTEL